MESKAVSRSQSAQNSFKVIAVYWLQTGMWLLLFLLAFEIGIRAFIMKNPLDVYNPGWGMVPEGNSYQMQGLEGFAVTHFEEYGEIRSLSMDGTSIVVLGDSFTRGAQVPDSKKFVTLTERLLLERGRNVDLHNLGSPAQSIADILYQAPAVMDVFSPEIVIIQANRLSFKLAYDPTRQNYLIFRDGGIALAHQEQAVNATSQKIISASGLLSFFSYRIKVLQTGTPGGSSQMVANTFADDTEMNAPADTPSSGSADAEIRFRVMVEALKKAFPYSKIVILVIPNVPIIPEDPSAEILWYNADDEGFVRALGRIEGVYIVYPRDAFRKNYEENRLLPRGFFNSAPNTGHLNESGHEMVASVLAGVLLDILK